jgi:hypothetical protein
MVRLLAFVATTVAAAATIVGTAAADPVKNPHTFALPVTCDGVSGIVYPTGSAAHQAGSTAIGVLKGQSGPDGTFFKAGWEASELTACTSPAAPGVTFYVLITPRKG